MRAAPVCAAVACVSAAVLIAQTQAPVADPDRQYRLGPDSVPQDGVPRGEIRGPFSLPSEAYPGHAAYVLGIRARAVRRGGSGQPHDLQ